MDDPLAFLADPQSIMITDTLARETGLKLGSSFPMSTMDGKQSFTVRGIMRAGGTS